MLQPDKEKMANETDSYLYYVLRTNGMQARISTFGGIWMRAYEEMLSVRESESVANRKAERAAAMFGLRQGAGRRAVVVQRSVVAASDT